MTQPKATAERLTELETKQAQIFERLTAIDTRLAQVVAPGTTLDVTDRLAAMEQRVTAIETTLATKVPGFEAVGLRAEYGAYVDDAILSSNAPPPSEQRLDAIDRALSKLSNDVAALSATRGRSGLSGRLRNIEEKLDRLLPPETPHPPGDM